LQANSGLDHTAATAKGNKAHVSSVRWLKSSLIGKTTGFPCNISHISKFCIG
jgi:hypothetical protein